MPRWPTSDRLAAALVALLAFALYRATLLPDLELGDSASFQTMAGSAVITPRDGYPLYYAIAGLFVPFFASPAQAMNLLSAVEASLACGVIVLVALELSGSVIAAAAAALLFAGSYTFWSQSVIAEVYALHILLVALTLLLLLRWSRRPSAGRLTAFFALYALAFGNHLSMILLAPAYAFFLLTAAPGGWRSMATPRVAGAAAACAAFGALQYGWNFRTFWLLPAPPESIGDALQAFWFDVTKSDWRDTMVLRVPAVMAGERVRMYLFDLQQQFGWAAPLLAVAGFAHLVRTDWKRAVLLAGVFAASVAFALGYNVGDAHVFFLPAHLAVALLVAPGVASLKMKYVPVFAVAVLALAGARIYRDFPALDRSADTRPAMVLTRLTEGLDDRSAVLLTDLNWQVQNGLTYFAERIRPEVAYARLLDVILYAPALIRDNLAIGRDIVLTDRARQQLHAAYGPLIETARDDRVPVPTLREAIDTLPRGARYVLCVLKPSREFVLDRVGLAESLRRLTGDRVSDVGEADYVAVAGVVGEPPALVETSMAPFRLRVPIDGLPVDIRMESWLAFDTIRRMGFGHVVANRHHALIVERGVSFVALDGNGRAGATVYEAGIFAAQPRYRVLSSK